MGGGEVAIERNELFCTLGIGGILEEDVGWFYVPMDTAMRV